MRPGAAFFALALCLAPGAAAKDPEPPPVVAAPPQTMNIARLAAPPTLADIVAMAPTGAAAAMSKLDVFTQARPRDGDPSTQRTEAYVGYDDKNLYIAWICFDTEPGKVRANLTPREQAFGDDFVEVTLDTFQDRRRGYVFWSNPLGVQAEGLWSEENDDPQWSWDTTWETSGKTTPQGYVVLMAIPFKSLRFFREDPKTWGIVLLRRIPRVDEWSYWPRVSTQIRGRLSQEGLATGLEKISPGRNIQLTPYVFADQTWLLDPAALPDRVVVRQPFDATGGLDAKFVFGDNVVLDATVNPDFSQVESDQPQIAVNQRFELFYPEKRPFFLENADLFQLSAANLLFTRRIVDPSFGLRTTGKVGKYAFGALIADDEAPGAVYPVGDPQHGSAANFGVVSVRRDILRQSSIRLFATDREYRDSYNRVGGVEANFRIGKGWVFNVAGFDSATRTTDGQQLHGPLFDVFTTFNNRVTNAYFEYFDVDAEFDTRAGFVPRTGVRTGQGNYQYQWRPEGKVLISYGPALSGFLTYDRSGTRLDWQLRPAWIINLVGSTYFELFLFRGQERLLPGDLPGVTEPIDFDKERQGIFVGSEYFKKVSVYGDYRWGNAINYFPAFGPPVLADERLGSVEFVVTPISPLTINLIGIFDRLDQPGTGDLIFHDVITRLKVNWQFNLAWSLRFILQKHDFQADPALIDVPAPELDNVNADLLLTWLLHPGTALYFGYNTNASNLAQFEPDVPGVTRDGLVNDGRRVFAKFSYQFRL